MNELINKLNNDEAVIGTWCHIPNSQVVEIIGSTHLDFIIFDMEHGPHSFSNLPQLICAAEKSNIEPLVRVPSITNSNILRSLDSGAKGIVVPHVDSVEKAEHSINLMYYGKNENSRGVATLTRASMFDIKNERHYLRNANNQIISILIIEDRAGLECLEQIARVKKLDVIFVGLYDLCQCLGFDGDLEHPKFLSIFEKTIKQIRKLGIFVGSYAPNSKSGKRLFDMGVNFLTLNVDGSMLRVAYDNEINKLNALISKKH